MPPIVALWEKVVADLLDRTQRFPKSVRFTFAGRIDNLALDVLERLVEARWSAGRTKQDALRSADLDLAKLRLLLRICCDRRHLDRRGWEHVSRQLDEVGRMLGGWRAHAAR